RLRLARRVHPAGERGRAPAGACRRGAGAIGDYTGCAWSVTGTGEFTPGAGADPAIGQVGAHEQVEERHLGMVVPLDLIPAVTAALRNAHPYEEPAISFIATHPVPSRHGRGRIDILPGAAGVSELRAALAHELPGVQIRVRPAAGEIRKVAICS